MNTNNNDIDALLGLAQGIWPDKYATLCALVAERNGQAERIKELELSVSILRRNLATMIAENPPADRDRELRGRLVCAALTRLCADPRYDFPEEAAIAIADRALAAMRKGEQHAK